MKKSSIDIDNNNTAGIIVVDLGFITSASNDPGSEPNPDNIVNGGGTNAASASSSGSFGVEATTPYGDGKVVCQASGGVANRGSIATVANYEDCYGG